MPKKTRKHLQAAASNAWAAKKERSNARSRNHLPTQTQGALIPDETDKCECGYNNGGVDNSIGSDDEFVLWELEDGKEWDSDEELSKYDEEQMEKLKEEAAELVKPSPYEKIFQTQITVKKWQKIKANQSPGYHGQSKRTQEQQQKQEQQKWSMRDQHSLQKKGAGQGIHQSDARQLGG